MYSYLRIIKYKDSQYNWATFIYRFRTSFINIGTVYLFTLYTWVLGYKLNVIYNIPTIYILPIHIKGHPEFEL